MHELSIATALLEQVRRHAPPGAAVRSVHVRAGPLKAIEPLAIQLAWRAATLQTICEDAELELETLPWRLSCPACGHEWEGADPLAGCRCGGDRCRVRGGDDLVLVSLDVDETTIEKEAC